MAGTPLLTSAACALMSVPSSHGPTVIIHFINRFPLMHSMNLRLTSAHGIVLLSS
jgi:hypothetical protein